MSLFFDIPITHSSGVDGGSYGFEHQVGSLRLYFAEGQYYRLVKYHLNQFEPMAETFNSTQLYSLTLDVILSKNQSLDSFHATSIADIDNYQLQPDEVRTKITMFRVVGNNNSGQNDGWIESYFHKIFFDSARRPCAWWYTHYEISPLRYYRVYLPDDVKTFSVDLTYQKEEARVIRGPTGKTEKLLDANKIISVPFQKNTKLMVNGEDGLQCLFDTSICVRNDLDNDVNCRLTFNRAPVLAYEPTDDAPASFKHVNETVYRVVNDNTKDIRQWFDSNVGCTANGELYVYGHCSGSYFSYQWLKLYVSDNEFYFAVARLYSQNGVTKWCLRKFKDGDELSPCPHDLQPNFAMQPGDVEVTILLPNALEEGATTIQYYSEYYSNPFNPNYYLCFYKGTKPDAELAFKILPGELNVTRVTYEHNVSYTNDIAFIEYKVGDEVKFKSPIINSTVDSKFDSQEITNNSNKVLTIDSNPVLSGQWKFNQCPTSMAPATHGDQLISYKSLMSILNQIGIVKLCTDVSILIRADFVSTWAQICYLEIYTANGRLVPLYQQTLKGTGPIKAVFKWFRNDSLPDNAASDFEATTGKTTITMRDLKGYELQEGEFFANVYLPATLTPGLTESTVESYCDPFYRDGYNGLLWYGSTGVNDVYKIEMNCLLHEPITRVRFKTARYMNSKAQVKVDYTLAGDRHQYDSTEKNYDNNVFDYQVGV